MEQVTVVIPTRTDGRGLDRAVASVLNQRGVQTRLVVVVDGSSLVAAADRRCLESLDQRHRLVMAGAHGQPGPLRNVGVALSQTPWIAFLDDDDEWHEEKLARQLALLRSTGAVLVASNATKVHDGQSLGPYFREPPPGSIKLSDAIITNWLITSTVLTSTQALRRVGGFPVETSMKFCDDYVAWLKLLTRGEGRIQNEELVNYSVSSPNSLSEVDVMSGSEVRRTALRRLLQDAKEMELDLSLRVRRRINGVSE